MKKVKENKKFNFIKYETERCSDAEIYTNDDNDDSEELKVGGFRQNVIGWP